MGNRISDNIPEWQLRFFSYSTTLADSICDYLKEKNISKEQLSIFFDIKIEEVESMLSGHYDFNLMEMVRIELLLNNHYLSYKKELIIEKKHHY
jgi:hypothetical protein